MGHDKAIYYTKDNLPPLSETSKQHLEEIKERAAVRRQKRLEKEKGHE